MKKLLISCLAFPLLADISHVYEGVHLESKIEVPYVQVVTSKKESKNGVDKTIVTHKNPEGKITSEHTLTYKEGQLQEYRMQNDEYDVSSLVRVEGKTAFLEFIEKGKKKQGTIDWEPHSVVGHGLRHYIQDHIQDLREGKSLRVKIAAPVRLDSFTFDFTPIEGDEKDPIQVKEGKWIKVKMKPASIFISALVKTAYYYLDKKTGKTAMYVGVTGVYKPGDDAGFYGTIRYDS